MLNGSYVEGCPGEQAGTQQGNDFKKSFHQGILILGRREGYMAPCRAAKQVWSYPPQTYTPVRLTSRTISTTSRSQHTWAKRSGQAESSF